MAVWIKVNPLQDNDGGAFMCSECKTGDYDIEGIEDICPFCGAKMNKESEELDNGKDNIPSTISKR